MILYSFISHSLRHVSASNCGHHKRKCNNLWCCYDRINNKPALIKQIQRNDVSLTNKCLKRQEWWNRFWLIIQQTHEKSKAGKQLKIAGSLNNKTQQYWFFQPIKFSSLPLQSPASVKSFSGIEQSSIAWIFWSRSLYSSSTHHINHPSIQLTPSSAVSFPLSKVHPITWHEGPEGE